MTRHRTILTGLAVLATIAAFASLRFACQKMIHHPVSQWRGEAGTPASVTIAPRLDNLYERPTIRDMIAFTNAADAAAWAKALAEARPLETVSSVIPESVLKTITPSSWPPPNRDRGPRSFYLTVEYADGNAVRFEIWVCDHWPLVSAQEEFDGEAIMIVPFPVKYSYALRQLLDSVLANDLTRWVPAQREYWDVNSMTFKGIGN